MLYVILHINSFMNVICFISFSNIQVNPKLHKRRIYLHECEMKEIAKLKILFGYENEGYHIQFDTLKMCEPNGWYSGVQINGEM